MMGLGLGLLSMSACKVFDHELPPDVVAIDAGPDVAGDAALACDLTRPFGSAVLVDGVVSSSEDASMRLSPDENTAYFFSAQTGNQLLYTANRVRRADPFGNVKVLENVNVIPGNQYNPTITADGMTLFFASSQITGLGDNDIYQATRSTPTGDFTSGRLAPNVNTSGSEVQPYVTHDGTTMYFVQGPQGHAHVMRASGSATGGFIRPGPVFEVFGPTNDSDPVQSADGLTLFWSSDRPDAQGAGGFDVWQAHRSTASGAFRDLAPVVTVNTAGADAPSDVSEDGCRLYITSTRNGKTGIYVATRPL